MLSPERKRKTPNAGLASCNAALRRPCNRDFSRRTPTYDRRVEALAALLALALLLVVVRHVAYRGSHPHTAADLEAARKQSAQLSRATRKGRAYEQFVPFLPEFEERYDRADARFLGAPIDFLVFDGLYSDDEDLAEIVFLEIKSGRPALNSREQAVREAVEEGRVRWERIVLR